ncbi:hypothetical protein [Micromonospora sp. WMMD714]|uniref:hypothetical protein n=1 Tax=Micromonospora sp. WMMD714 TaxID=3016097 RepID=UPI00249BED1E|nr:hypothetical protein [Micromonospora sp. WMMD714]WFE65648.1 hypothetical protein O7625_21235 [Micromonospora sp. WMMD714]
MNFRRSARPGRTVDRAEAERLLDSTALGVPSSADDPLARLLAAAAAPARPGELAGEQAAMAGFRAARGAAAPVPGRRRRRLTTGVVAWIAGLAVTATAGVAFAAVTLDDRPAERAPGPVPSASDTGSTSPTPHRPDDPSRRPTAAPGGVSPGTAVPPATPSHGKPTGNGGWTGQCRAYLAKPPEQRAKALTKPGFAGLVAAAGGPERVEEYCRALVPDRPAPGPATGGPKGGAGPKGGTGPGSAGGPGGTPSPGPKN